MQIQVLPEGGETPIFKQFFKDWKDRDQSDGFGKVYVTEKVARIQQIPFDASKLHSSPQMAAQHNMVDDGSGTVEVFSRLSISFCSSVCVFIRLVEVFSRLYVCVLSGLFMAESGRGNIALAIFEHFKG